MDIFFFFFLGKEKNLLFSSKGRTNNKKKKKRTLDLFFLLFFVFALVFFFLLSLSIQIFVLLSSLRPNQKMRREDKLHSDKGLLQLIQIIIHSNINRCQTSLLIVMSSLMNGERSCTHTPQMCPAFCMQGKDCCLDVSLTTYTVNITS